MFKRLLAAIKRHALSVLQNLEQWLKAQTKPAASSLMLGTAGGLDGIGDGNALLRQQLIVLKRSVKRPKLSRFDR